METYERCQSEQIKTNKHDVTDILSDFYWPTKATK